MMIYLTRTIANMCIAWVLSLFYIYMIGEIVVNKNTLEEFLIFMVPLQLITTVRGVYFWVRNK